LKEFAQEQAQLAGVVDLGSHSACRFLEIATRNALIPKAAIPTRRKSMFEGIFQPLHLAMIAGIALLIFGPKKLPELGKGLGESIRGFKSAMAGKDEASTSQAPGEPTPKS
jgi:sec-independent protein translocase protein TatA